MKRAIVLAAMCLACMVGRAWSADAVCEQIFDGKTLDGWDGNPDVWSVQDGAITGKTTAEKPIKGNTFLIWRKGDVGDFELKLEYKLIGGNSGIQYRSFEVPNEKWVVGGYQADFEAGDNFSGILYGERYRGILANRGQKTVIKEGGKVEVAGSVGDSAQIQSKIKKEDWNTYEITAKGFHFVHKINGVVTSEATDEDSARRERGIIALQVHAGPPMQVQFRNICLKRLDAQKSESTTAAAKKKVVFIAGKPSHGFADHEHNAGCLLLAKLLEKAMPNFETKVYLSGWPDDPKVLDGADAVVMFSDGGGGHMAIPHLEQLDSLAKKGVGIACLHYAVEVPKGDAGNRFLDWIGGYFESDWSVNPFWTPSFEKIPDHPVSRGVKPFKAEDEWYYHMRFRKDMEGVTPILSALPPADTLKRPDGPHENNPHVRAAVLERKEPQHVAWVAERKDGGRGFGFTGGHPHWNWGKPDFRKVVLNGIVWVAKGEVPANGVTTAVTMEDLDKNLDPKGGNRKVDREEIRKKYGVE
jgi:type 1 glutamine amidotransferase